MVQPALRTFPFLTLLLLFGASPVPGETVRDHLVWPPVFERQFGNPVLQIRTGRGEGRVKGTKWSRKISVSVPRGDDVPGRVGLLLADHFLDAIWERYLSPNTFSRNEQRLNMTEEWIPMSRERFFQVGRALLAGKSCGDPLYDAWWKVRMDLPLSPSPDYLLSLNSILWAEPERSNKGHYSFAIRRRGGDADGDFILDFRAPWSEDRRPRVTESPNLHNTLKLKAYRENYYDWIYTQTHHRHSRVTATFVRVAAEQVLLLQAYDGKIHEAGNFRIFQKNCTSLGTRFMNRILPLDRPLPSRVIDFPLRAIEVTVDRFGGKVALVEMESRTLEAGNEPTNNNQLRPAVPNRVESPGFRRLLTVPEIN